MYKRLKIAVPVIQVLGWIALVLYSNLIHNQQGYLNWGIPAKSILMQLNFPVLVPWLAISNVVDYFHGSLPNLNGAALATATLVLSTVFLSSIAVFWYFVVSEIEMRLRGKSLLRFSTWSKQIIIITVLFCFGVGGIFKAYSQTNRLWYVSRTEGVFNGFVFAGWGIVFIGIGIFDLASFLKNRRRCADGAHPVST